MKLTLRTKAKSLISKLSFDSPRARYLAYLARFEKWRRSRTEKYPTFENRYRMYDFLKTDVIRDAPIDYLEFGVSKGESLQYWTEIDRNPDSRFWGFDTFFGLPDKWDVFTTTVEKNAFSMNGKPPAIDDARNTFIKGLFQATLPGFLADFKPTGRVVIHNDADIYPSTLYTLCQCNEILKPGAIVIFDEFTSVLHEFRAWEDYCAAYMREYTVLAATDGPHDYYSQVAIEMK